MTNQTRTAQRSTKAAGVEPGQRRLNGPQTTGRDYRNLSEPEYEMTRENNLSVAMRDGANLLADVYRPDADGRFPALIAASPYPRQIQDLGAPMGIIEAGASDFWVPRGYVHVIANLRGTCGSDGEFGFFDGQERQDMYDLVEWAAAQPWCNGKVGMIGISYFAMTQLEAAVERPPHLVAIFPLAVTTDLYEAANHHGLFSSGFVTSFLTMIGVMSARSDQFLRGKIIGSARRVLNQPRLHERFATMNGETSMGGLRQLMKLKHDPHPWDDLWRSVAVEHPLRDEWWDDRNVLPLMDRIDIPVYLGCDWENAPLHLPSTFSALKALQGNDNVRVGMLGEYGLTWPWESLHVEALAWFDHWLKDHDTGIMEGPAIRYFVPEADEWRTAETWPPPSTYQEWALRSDGALALDEGDSGSRSYMTLGPGLGRVKPSPTDPPALLTWTSAPLAADIDMVGDIELQLDASITATDTGWIVILQDIAPDDSTYEVTGGWLRASLRHVDESASRVGAPDLPCRRFDAVPVGENVAYRIPLVPNARRFKAGHRIAIILTSDDQNPDVPTIMTFHHGPVGTTTINTIGSSSRLLLPVVECD